MPTRSAARATGPTPLRRVRAKKGPGRRASEADLGRRLRFRRRVEVRALLERLAGDLVDCLAADLAELGVVVLHRGVVVTACDEDAVLGPFELLLEIVERLVGL